MGGSGLSGSGMGKSEWFPSFTPLRVFFNVSLGQSCKTNSFLQQRSPHHHAVEEYKVGDPIASPG
jgi:hypothetical protein